MERRNPDLREPHDGSSQTTSSGRTAIASHVDRVSGRVRRFVDRAGVHPSHDHVSEWRTGAYIVAAMVDDGARTPTEFKPSQTFISFCDLDGIAEPRRSDLCRYLIAETDRRLSNAVHHLLPRDDVELLLRVGQRHGRDATRSLLSAILPHLVELEYGIAASVGADIRRALKEAA
jgi:hypothetical protein